MGEAAKVSAEASGLARMGGGGRVEPRGLEHLREELGLEEIRSGWAMKALLRQRRRDLCYSERDLAKMLCVSPSQVTKWESEACHPATSTTFQLIRALDLSVYVTERKERRA